MSTVRRVEHAAKLRWHLDIVAHAPTHAWALALYRAGERHPETVTDYFPHRQARAHWPDLADALKRHAGDERRHVALYARAIESTGEAVPEVDEPDVFNHAIRSHTPVSWAIDEGDSREVQRVKLAHFLAHAHHLEKRVSRSLDYHLEACGRLGKSAVTALLERVHADEDRHVRSTRDALAELSTAGEREEILGVHARAEAEADRSFSARQVRAFVGRLDRRIPRSRGLFYSACAFVMEQSRV